MSGEFASIERACRVCGCTEDDACMTARGPCHWIAPDLCSACAGGFACDAIGAEDAADDTGLEACPATAPAAPHAIIWRTESFGYCVRCRTEFAP